MGNCIEALVKPIGVVEGISDVPWHKDCSLGMHSYRCCGLTCGISVTGATRGRGSCAWSPVRTAHSCSPCSLRSSSDLPIVDLPTEAGDVTVHCSARFTCRSRPSIASGA